MVYHERIYSKGNILTKTESYARIKEENNCRFHLKEIRYSYK